MPNPNDKRPTTDPMTDEPGERPRPDRDEEDSQYGGTERQAPGYGEPDSGEDGGNTPRRRERQDQE